MTEKKKVLMPASTEILPCPFCGGEASVFEFPSGASVAVDSACFSVGCTTEDCYGYHSYAEFSRRSDAVKEWNRRDQPKGEVGCS